MFNVQRCPIGGYGVRYFIGQRCFEPMKKWDLNLGRYEALLHAVQYNEVAFAKSIDER